MKKLRVLLVIAILVLIVGYYRGWFTVNRDRIREDEQKAVEKAKDVGGKIVDDVRKEIGKPKVATNR